MENVIMTQEEADTLKEKARKWDQLEKAISEFYCDESGEYNEENPKRKGDICDIGEVAAMATGWL